MADNRFKIKPCGTQSISIKGIAIPFVGDDPHILVIAMTHGSATTLSCTFFKDGVVFLHLPCRYLKTYQLMNTQIQIHLKSG